MAALSYRSLKRALAEPETGPPGPVTSTSEFFRQSKSEFFRRSLPAHAITGLLDTFTTARQHRELNFTPMGGGYNRVPADATAFIHRSERFLLEHVAAGADAERWVQRSWAAVHPWGSRRVYPNFPDPDLNNWAEAYHGGNHARLAQVKRSYDPERLLHFHQAL